MSRYVDVFTDESSAHEIAKLRTKLAESPYPDKSIRVWYTYSLGFHENLRGEGVLTHTVQDVFTMHTVQNFAFACHANGTFITTGRLKESALPQHWGYIDE